jgi:hypothetical protein
MPSACHWWASSFEIAAGRGSEAIATPLHSKAAKPAPFQPTRGSAGESAMALPVARPKVRVRLG